MVPPKWQSYLHRDSTSRNVVFELGKGNKILKDMGGFSRNRVNYRLFATARLEYCFCSAVKEFQNADYTKICNDLSWELFVDTL